ncbi:site-specific DNA-methyltransferase [Flavobacteriaceae bacterium]|nr:site-specific DNA-methyltransferase [Flavobacteriaceae bacterium]
MNIIYNKDCIDHLKKIKENSIDACITDPPYNYEFIGHKWNFEEIQRRIGRVQSSNTLVKHIPYGSGLAGGVRNKRWYEKNSKNINDYRDWTLKWGEDVFRVLKPGAYIFVFNSSRTVAHVQVALEQAGFYARDIVVWKKNSGIPKGINLSSKMKKDGHPDYEKWSGWHSCFRNEWEAIAVLQKPLENNYPTTIKKWGVGVLKTINKDGSFQSNIFENLARDKKQDFNMHCTVKPTSLIKRLIELSIPIDGNDKIVLDPFMGSGTTAIAAIDLNINYLGYEIVPEYHEIANNRIMEFQRSKKERLFV